MGKADESRAELATYLAQQNPAEVYKIACAAALAAQVCEKADEAQAKEFAEQALELLASAVAYGYRDARQIRTDDDLAGLHAEPRFVALLDGMEPPARYAGVWREEAAFESALETSDGSPGDRARQLAAEGYPFCSFCLYPFNIFVLAVSERDWAKDHMATDARLSPSVTAPSNPS